MSNNPNSPKEALLEHGQPIAPETGGTGAVLHGGLLLQTLLGQLEDAMLTGLTEIMDIHTLALHGDEANQLPGLISLKTTALSDMKGRYDGAIITLEKYRVGAVQDIQAEQANAIKRISEGSCDGELARSGINPHEDPKPLPGQAAVSQYSDIYYTD
jgi:hypothetical protein